jgi:hypothetical protein
MQGGYPAGEVCYSYILKWIFQDTETPDLIDVLINIFWEYKCRSLFRTSTSIFN